MTTLSRPRCRHDRALPFFASGRYPRPDLIGRCAREPASSRSSGRELVERVRGSEPRPGGARHAHAAIASRCSRRAGRSGCSPTSRSSRPARSRCRSIRRSSAEQVAFILRDSGASIAIVSTPAQLEKLCSPAAGDGAVTCARSSSCDPPATPAARARARRQLSLADVAARGHRRILDGWGVAQANFRTSAKQRQPGRSRDDHLHVGHDGRAEGRRC